jgi:Alginate lyase
MKRLFILLVIFYFPVSSILQAQDSLKHNLRVSNKLLKVKPHSIMEKNQIPPSGDKHDYMSLGPYWWPDSHSENGEPYIRKDGERNPEAGDYTDHNFFSETNERIFNLALAYYLSADEEYAKKAVEFLRVWYLNTDTKMNPNLNFAQAIKGINSGRGAGVLDGRSIAFMIEGLGLIDNSPSFTQEDRKGIHQ